MVDDATIVASIEPYQDPNCSVPDQFGTSISGYSVSYTIGDTVTASDGVPATRITMIDNSVDVIDPYIFEGIYRINGIELVFGQYTEGEVPELGYDIIYTRIN